MLRTYFEIASDGNYSRLAKKKNVPKEVCAEQWEKIVHKNNQETGNFGYINYKESLQNYYDLLKRYHKVKLCLLKLSIRCDYKVIEMLAEEGYKISKKKNQYDETLYKASRKSDNLITKIKSKRRELDIYSQENGGKSLTFEQALEATSLAAGYNVRRKITLAGYNELRKQIKQRNDGSRNRTRRPNQ